MLQGLIQLYRQVCSATLQSFLRCWMITIAIIVYAIAMILMASMVGGFGMVGGLLLGITNAFIIGSILTLIEQAVQGARSISLSDVQESLGQYFWDVIGVGFILWIPVWAIEQGMQANPNGQLIATAIFLLGFILLNPALEVIYQVRHDSPLDVIKESYEFVLENWIEWFLPIAIILAPLGFQIFFELSSRIGRAAGLNFIELIFIPVTVLASWFQYLGLPGEFNGLLLLLVAPPLAVMMLLFRGHLFSALHGTSRRGRLFRAHTMDE